MRCQAERRKENDRCQRAHREDQPTERHPQLHHTNPNRRRNGSGRRLAHREGKTDGTEPAPAYLLR
eukprot:2804246-Alexandrium_andersonii.AAC.1